METLPKLAQLKRADRRKLTHLLATQSATPEWIAQIEAGDYYVIGVRNWPNPVWLADVKWMLKMQAQLGITEADVLAIKRAHNLRGWEGRRAMMLRPVREKKDNKNQKASSRGSSGNTIRYPRKVRSKACWRRFYKLFPQLQPA